MSFSLNKHFLYCCEPLVNFQTFKNLTLTNFCLLSPCSNGEIFGGLYSGIFTDITYSIFGMPFYMIAFSFLNHSLDVSSPLVLSLCPPGKGASSSFVCLYPCVYALVNSLFTYLCLFPCLLAACRFLAGDLFIVCAQTGSGTHSKYACL